jgi:Zn-dependent protease with chaperone function
MQAVDFAEDPLSASPPQDRTSTFTDSPPDTLPAETAPITEYFSGPMPQVRLPRGYQVGLVAVAFAMVLLPLLYLGFMALVGWGTWLWTTHAVEWFFPVSGGTRHVFWVLGILYVIPILIGLILLLFMFKSFFSNWRVIEFATPISHLEHPEIFRFLGQLCREMNAPIPSRVDVSLSINASAGFRAGFGSFFGNDIMLSFGLPLVAGMNCREFAAVLAHELGHFTQRSAMRCDFLVRTIHGWLFRAVFEPDELDESLEEAGNAGAFGLLLSIFARMAIAFTRALMWLLLVLSHALVSFLSRQMEFHADACAAAVTGGDGFVAMLNKLRILNTSAARAAIELKHRVAPKYPDDFSTYIALQAAQCSAELQGKVHAAAAGEKTRWFRSHPSDAERAERATLSGYRGIIHDLRPATILFQNFQELSRTLTLASYLIRRRGRPVPSDQLLHVEPATPEQVPDTIKEEAAIHSYFGGLGSFLSPVLAGGPVRIIVGSATDKLEQIRQAKVLLGQQALQPLTQQLLQLDARMLQALEMNAVATAGLPLNPQLLSTLQTEEPAVLLRSVEAQQEELGVSLEPFRQAARLRLMTALNLLPTPSVAAAFPQFQQTQEEVRDLLHVAATLGAAFPYLHQLRKEYSGLQTLLGVREQNGVLEPAAHTALADSVQRVNGLLSQIRTKLGATGLPLLRVGSPISIADYARSKEFDSDPARMAQLEAQSHLQKLFAVYYEVLGRLVALALRVEEQLKV